MFVCSDAVTPGPSMQFRFRRVTSTPDLGIFQKYRDTPHNFIAIFLQKFAILLAGNSIYASSLYHEAPPICIAMLLQKY